MALRSAVSAADCDLDLVIRGVVDFLGGLGKLVVVASLTVERGNRFLAFFDRPSAGWELGWMEEWVVLRLDGSTRFCPRTDEGALAFPLMAELAMPLVFRPEV